jgi:hypothetical protein
MKLFRAWALTNWMGLVDVPLEFFADRPPEMEPARMAVMGYDSLSIVQVAAVQARVAELFREAEAEELRAAVKDVFVEEVLLPRHHSELSPICNKSTINLNIGAGLAEYNLSFDLWAVCHTSRSIQPGMTANGLRYVSLDWTFLAAINREQARRMDERAKMVSKQGK